MTYAACMHGFPAPWAPGADLHRSASAAEAGWHARRVGILGTTRRHQVYPLDARVGEGLQERGRALHRRAAAVHGRHTGCTWPRDDWYCRVLYRDLHIYTVQASYRHYRRKALEVYWKYEKPQK